jgi:thymidylate synthase ThyX
MQIKGKGGISAKIIADSVSSDTNQRIITMELEYPRFIHSEFMTHRVFSRNAASRL